MKRLSPPPHLKLIVPSVSTTRTRQRIVVDLPEDLLSYAEAWYSLGKESPAWGHLPRHAGWALNLVLMSSYQTTLAQANPHWKWPRWVREQILDPESPAFVQHRDATFPGMPTTWKNWMMLSGLAREKKAVAGPDGELWPGAGCGATVCWLVRGHEVLSPAETGTVVQRLLDGYLPVLTTTWRLRGAVVTQEAFVAPGPGAPENGPEGIWLKVGVVAEMLEDRRPSPLPLSVAVVHHPTSPVGPILVPSLSYRDRELVAGRQVRLAAGKKPDGLAVSNFAGGMVSELLRQGKVSRAGRAEIACRAGFATGAQVYRLHHDRENEYYFFLPLHGVAPGRPPKQAFPVFGKKEFEAARGVLLEEWNGFHDQGLKLRLPDEDLQRCFSLSRTLLGMLAEKRGQETWLCVGPTRYHQFWFRDAAYLLQALQVLGYRKEARAVLDRYPSLQRKDGLFTFFLSADEKEWDINGQALWSFSQHDRFYPDPAWRRRLFPVVRKAMAWLTAHTRQGKALLPPSWGAEHLGVEDNFYWDDFWALAGGREAIRLARQAGARKEAAAWTRWLSVFEKTVGRSLDAVTKKIGLPVIPASPGRALDSCVIGTVGALWPCRALPASDPNLQGSLDWLLKNAVRGGGFWHGAYWGTYGPYLTMQIAHALVLSDRVKEAVPLLEWIKKSATPLGTWPEGINGRTGKGGMGDMPHGWAAADLVLLVRDLLLEEEDDAIHLGRGVPASWYSGGPGWEIHAAPVEGGRTWGYRVEVAENTVVVILDQPRPPKTVILHLGGGTGRYELVGQEADRVVFRRCDAEGTGTRFTLQEVGLLPQLQDIFRPVKVTLPARRADFTGIVPKGPGRILPRQRITGGSGSAVRGQGRGAAVPSPRQFSGQFPDPARPG